MINRASGAALHVHGGTGQVDARVELPGDAARDGLLSVAGQGAGFVVGRDRVWTFDRSTLTVVTAAATAAPEVPVAIEVIGGPYLVYRQAGTVVRLGRPPVVTHAGGPLGPPVRTPGHSGIIADPPAAPSSRPGPGHARTATAGRRGARSRGAVP